MGSEKHLKNREILFFVDADRGSLYPAATTDFEALPGTGSIIKIT